MINIVSVDTQRKVRSWHAHRAKAPNTSEGDAYGKPVHRVPKEMGKQSNMGSELWIAISDKATHWGAIYFGKCRSFVLKHWDTLKKDRKSISMWCESNQLHSMMMWLTFAVSGEEAFVYRTKSVMASCAPYLSTNWIWQSLKDDFVLGYYDGIDHGWYYNESKLSFGKPYLLNRMIHVKPSFRHPLKLKRSCFTKADMKARSQHYVLVGGHDSISTNVVVCVELAIEP